jgi:hypothetical protein
MGPEPPRHKPPAAAILLVPVVVGLILALFAWPSARLEPRDLPVGVAGAPPAAQALGAREGAFDVRTYPDEAAARQGIEDREVYGAFVLSPAGLEVLTASAASQAVAQQLERASAELRRGAAGGAGPGAQSQGVTVEDVVPARRGAALASSVLPLVIAGILAGAAAVLLAAGLPSRIGLVLVGSVLSGLVATLIVQSWLEIVEGDWLANAAALSLTVLAIAAAVAGLFALFGPPGAVVGAVIMVLVGNPFSGVGSAPELLPEPAGTIGQLMPPGAGGNLLRSTGFFDGAGGGGHVVVLAAWALAGLLLLVAAGATSRRTALRE